MVSNVIEISILNFQYLLEQEYLNPSSRDSESRPSMYERILNK